MMLGMLIDISSSMDIYIPAEKDAGARFFQEILRPRDKAFVADFRAGVEMLQDVTRDAKLLEAGLDRMIYDRAQAIGTALYDAIYVSCQQRLNGQNERKVLVVLSDGADYGSRKSLDDCVKIAQRTESMIYAIAYPYKAPAGFGGGGFGGRGGFGRGGGFGPMALDRKGAENIMRTLAEDTGGRLFTAPTGSHLSAIFKEIQEDVRSQYSISYAPPNVAKRDGQFRKIEVRTVSKQYKVQARKGYYAAKP
jgi:VWFA-related protein